MSKKFIHVLNEEKAKYLESLGFKSMYDTVVIGGKEKEVFVFIEDEKLLKILGDKSKFCKRDFYHSNILKF